MFPALEDAVNFSLTTITTIISIISILLLCLASSSSPFLFLAFPDMSLVCSGTKRLTACCGKREERVMVYLSDGVFPLAYFCSDSDSRQDLQAVVQLLLFCIRVLVVPRPSVCLSVPLSVCALYVCVCV